MGKIVVPMTSQAFYKSEESTLQNLAPIYKRYGNLIKKSSQMTNTPEEVIASFIFIESGGIANARNGMSIGLMQVNPPTIAESFYKEVEQGRMSSPEMEVIKRFLGKRADKLRLPKGKKRFSSYDFSIVQPTDLLKPEFNIFSGSLLLRQWMDNYIENGVVRMDKVIVAYNTGTKVRKRAEAHVGNTDTLIPKLPTITQAYVKKLVGKHGTLTAQVQ
jgi:hypothetical protein